MDKQERDDLYDLLGITEEEHHKLYLKALSEIGNEWEKELDTENKRKAVVAADEDCSLKRREAPSRPPFVADMQNHVLSENGEYVVYFDDYIVPGKSTLCVDTINKSEVFRVTINVYCHVCSISETGKYAAFQTANGYGEFSNQCATMLLYDVFNDKELLNRTLRTGWKDICRIEVLEDKEVIRLHYAEDFVDYDFCGNPIDMKQVDTYMVKYCDAYMFESYVYDTVNEVDACVHGFPDLCSENTVSNINKRFLFLINELYGYINPNRLSLLYKAVGKLFEDMANSNIPGALFNAISFYEKGLEINPALSVKKSLSRLRKKI